MWSKYMKKTILVLTLLATGCSFNTYEAKPVTNGGFEVKEEHGPLSDDEIPDCFSIIHKWGNGGTAEHSESLGEYCKKDPS